MISSSSWSFDRHATAPASNSASTSRRLAEAVRQTTATAGARFTHGPRRLHAVEPGQPVVHQHDVRLVLAHDRRCRRAVGDRGNDLHVGLQSEQQLERLAEALVVLDDDEADRLGHPRSLFRREQERIVRLAAVLHVQLEAGMELLDPLHEPVRGPARRLP